ncbi:hypothetical protein RIF29_19996 [Crotalaria pallida]|uniref:Uncharacterized protein n=1 Tax=Crotalaria pallida TaxID=3830 RepID=A0AAN9F0V9_CROPI
MLSSLDLRINVNVSKHAKCSLNATVFLSLQYPISILLSGRTDLTTISELRLRSRLICKEENKKQIGVFKINKWSISFYFRHSCPHFPTTKINHNTLDLIRVNFPLLSIIILRAIIIPHTTTHSLHLPFPLCNEKLEGF